MNLIVKSEEELLEMASELWHTLVNLRHHTRRWEEEHGSVLLATKKKCERKADDLIVKYNIQKTSSVKQINVEINKGDAGKE